MTTRRVPLPPHHTVLKMLPPNINSKGIFYAGNFPQTYKGAHPSLVFGLTALQWEEEEYYSTHDTMDTMVDMTNLGITPKHSAILFPSIPILNPQELFWLHPLRQTMSKHLNQEEESKPFCLQSYRLDSSRF